MIADSVPGVIPAIATTRTSSVITAAAIMSTAIVTLETMSARAMMLKFSNPMCDDRASSAIELANVVTPTIRNSVFTSLP